MTGPIRRLFRPARIQSAASRAGDFRRPIRSAGRPTLALVVAAALGAALPGQAGALTPSGHASKPSGFSGSAHAAGNTPASLKGDRAATRNLVRVRGRIGGNLYRTGILQNIPPQIMAEVVRMLGLGVDLERDLRGEDRFEILYEQFFNRRGGVVRTGHLLYASITLRGRRLGAWRFAPKGGTPDYFNARGQSLRTAFLRTPLDGARLTSRFGKRRHPVLGYTRMHRGLDFGAPAGTPVYAAGSGVVEFAARKGGYGNYVRIRHRGGHATAYAHLATFARDLRPGLKVRQGRIIGRVGATGLATGPHLHYEVLRGGQAIDPSAMTLAPKLVLRGDALAAFRWHAALLKIRPAVAAPTAAPQSSSRE